MKSIWHHPTFIATALLTLASVSSYALEVSAGQADHATHALQAKVERTLNQIEHLIEALDAQVHATKDRLPPLEQKRERIQNCLEGLQLIDGKGGCFTIGLDTIPGPMIPLQMYQYTLPTGKKYYTVDISNVPAAAINTAKPVDSCVECPLSFTPPYHLYGDTAVDYSMKVHIDIGFGINADRYLPIGETSDLVSLEFSQKFGWPISSIKHVRGYCAYKAADHRVTCGGKIKRTGAKWSFRNFALASMQNVLVPRELNRP